MNELALFAGAGGGLLGSKLLGWRAVCYVENDPYCVKVIQQRIRDGMLDDAPIWDDVRTFDGKPWAGCVDIVTGGDPCQANSNAHRYGKTAVSLADEFIRIIREVQPLYVLRENPARIRKDAPSSADYFAERLEDMGYKTTILEARACCMGFDHQRARLFVCGEMAYTNSKYVAQWKAFCESKKQKAPITRGILVENRTANYTGNYRGNDGVANRVDRLRAIGNGQVPAVVRAAWRLMQ